MNLNIQERLGLLELLPKEGGYAALKEVRKAKETFALTPQEIKDIKYTEKPAPAGNSITINWDTDKEIEKDLPISEYITGSIKDALVKLEKNGSMREQFFTLYEKFVL